MRSLVDVLCSAGERWTFMHNPPTGDQWARLMLSIAKALSVAQRVPVRVELLRDDKSQVIPELVARLSRVPVQDEYISVPTNKGGFGDFKVLRVMQYGESDNSVVVAGVIVRGVEQRA